MGITEELASFCATLEPGDIPPETRDQTKRVLVDTVGIAIGSIRAESTQPVLETIAELAGEGGSATILASTTRHPPAYAALANATLAHSLDFDETHREGSVHAAAPVLGALLAAGETVESTGEELLTAFVGGYDVTARLGIALNSEAHYARGFHATSTCGVFGATAAACILQGASAETIATGFGVNGSQAAGSLQFLENGAWNKRIHPGLAAHSGYIAARLAQHGFFAASDPIEGNRGFLQAYSSDPRPAGSIEDLGTGFEIDNTGLKPYPLCRFMHPAIDGIIELVESHDIDPEAVTRIEVDMSSAGYDIVGKPARSYPKSIVDAQFSMPFAAMLAVTRREATVDALYEAVDGGFTPTERRLMDATTTTAVNWADEFYPEKWGVHVRIGADSTYELRVEDARGDPSTPLSWADVRTKYRDLVVPVIGAEAAETVRERLESLEDHSVESVLAPIRESQFSLPV